MSIPWVEVPIPDSTPGLVKKIVWANMANGDVGDPIGFGEYGDRSVEVEGAFGVGGNVQVDGSNSGVNYIPLTSDHTNTINITGLALKNIAEATASTRPHVTAGNGATLVTVTMFLRR